MVEHRQAILALVLAVLAVTAAMAEPQISFTQVPLQGAGSDTRADVAGKVSGLKGTGDYKVVIYANAGLWYVQPTTEEPYTDIASDGSWKNWSHLGNRYAALLVRPSFEPPATTRSLPPVGGDVIARVEKDAKPLR